MGTRCLTYFYETNQAKPFTCIYRQFDGYPDGHGLEIAEYMTSKTMVNGYSDAKTQINGMGDLAVQLIVLLKDGKTEAGGIYVHAPDLEAEAWQDFEYHIWDNSVHVLDGGGNHLFKGTWPEFLEYCKNPYPEDEEG